MARKKKKVSDEYCFFIGKKLKKCMSQEGTGWLMDIDPEALYCLAKRYLNKNYDCSMVTKNKIIHLCNDLEILNKEI